MPFTPPDDFWIDIPGGTYTVGLLPDEARRLAEIDVESAMKELRVSKSDAAAGKLPKSCDVDWRCADLLDALPPREVTIAPFAFARRPLGNNEYRAFLEDTGESPPYGWLDPPPANDRFALGVDWSAFEKLLAWAGARLPFEAEWERAMRGTERRFYPLGNEYTPAGRDPLVTPDGIVYGTCELCADRWKTLSRASVQSTEEPDPRYPELCSKGTSLTVNIPSMMSLVTRGFGWPRHGEGWTGTVRFVRAERP